MGAYVSWTALTLLGTVGYAAGLYLAWRFVWRGADYAVCKQCGYDLRGLKVLRAGDDGRPCPECGQALDEDAVERASTRTARRPVHYAIGALILVASLLLGLCLTIWLLQLLAW